MKKDFYPLFYSIGIHRHHVAGGVFINAVLMAAENPARLEHITRDIYEPIAKRHGKTVGSVSKNIRDVRDTIMKHNGGRFLEQLTGCKNWYAEPPYPNELIGILARYIRDQRIPYGDL